ncbi:hypothetical protein AHAS_Ahas13G0503300 [Arachis hypogaea]
MEIIPVEEENTPIQKGSYKETLLTGPGLEENLETSSFMDDDEPNPEDKWYKDDEDVLNGKKPFNPCPTISVSKKEFEEWCKPWKNALMVKMLGKRVTFAFMEQRLQRDWEGKGKIHVIDMNRDYFLVHFSDEEDYNHALMEGPWMGRLGHWAYAEDRPNDVYPFEREICSHMCGDRPGKITCATYGHRSEQCMENLSIIGNPLDDVGIGTNLPVNGTADHGDNQNRKFEEPQNQHKNDTHGNGQNNPDFGPWMMVKRYSNKKKIQIGQRNSHENQKQVTKNNYEEDEVPTRKDPDGSRFTILHEETSEDA